MKLFLIICLILTAGFFSPLAAQNKNSNRIPQSKPILNLSKIEAEIFDAINEEREKVGKAKLAFEQKLAAIARNHSQRMAEEKFFSHTDRKGNGLVERLQHTDFDGWKKIGENIFYTNSLKDLVRIAVDSWMASPRHRQHILDEDFEMTGIGASLARDGSIYITEVFMKK